MIDWSETPSPFSFAMLSLAGLENSHSNISQLDTVWGQPHLHCRREPTRCTSSLEFCARSVARLTPTISALIKKVSARVRTRHAGVRAASTLVSTPGPNPTLFFHWNIFSGDPDHFRARILQLHFARHERNQSARD